MVLCFFLPDIQLFFPPLLHHSLKMACYLLVLFITVPTLEKQYTFDGQSPGGGINIMDTQVLSPASLLVKHLTPGQ